jgi:hypothetical protein
VPLGSPRAVISRMTRSVGALCADWLSSADQAMFAPKPNALAPRFARTDLADGAACKDASDEPNAGT